ncbi:MAG: electron transport complex subunit E [Desulfohalobiaceae bacterium]|nr:electron transport complex subunit E [Desulfohalobiaceae bacterium]
MSRMVDEFSKGLWKEVPPFRFVLGLCPTLAVTASVSSALGLGCGVIFVLMVSNTLVSAFRNHIPPKIRVPVFIVIIASAVTIVELMMEAYFYSLYEVLGIWIPLIVVNCLILGRAEAFARKEPVHLSVADGLGMGLGFTISLVVLATIREVIGAGTWFGLQVMPSSYLGFELFQRPPGAFICLGLMLALINYVSSKTEKRAAA